MSWQDWADKFVEYGAGVAVVYCSQTGTVWATAKKPGIEFNVTEGSLHDIDEKAKRPELESYVTKINGLKLIRLKPLEGDGLDAVMFKKDQDSLAVFSGSSGVRFAVYLRNGQKLDTIWPAISSAVETTFFQK